MQNGYIDKTGNPESGELELINKQTRRTLGEDEVYVFSVVLCDNDIDRDYERFTETALEKLAKLYIGKTGIYNHSMDGKDQFARIFSTEVEKISGKQTSDGLQYARLKARAYMPKTEANRDVILEIDAGIKREVSVGCAVGEKYCSICGANRATVGCSHLAGKEYVTAGKRQKCFTILDKPSDAYEWSFVAVPAQPLAGVVKAFRGKEDTNMKTADEIKKLFKPGQDVSLSAAQAAELLEFVQKSQSALSEISRSEEDLREEICKLFTLKKPEFSKELLKNMLGRMELDELKQFKNATFGAQLAKPVLCGEKAGKAEAYNQFII